MTDHLPECCRNDAFQMEPFPCICDRLRACEQRILLSKPNIELSAVYGYEAGRSDGLDAARDAVAAAQAEAGDINFCKDCADWSLAAIDALRGSPRE